MDQRLKAPTVRTSHTTLSIVVCATPLITALQYRIFMASMGVKSSAVPTKVASAMMAISVFGRCGVRLRMRRAFRRAISVRCS